MFFIMSELKIFFQNTFKNLIHCNISVFYKIVPLFVIPACPESAGIIT